jgi:dihydroflavonol-4-reductase
LNVYQKSIHSPKPIIMKILVTGATGFIGSHLAELLVKKNDAVRCLIRKTSNTVWLKDLPIEFVHGDLFDKGALRQAVEGVDFIYHSAGLTKAKTEEEYFQGNSVGTRNLLNAVREFNPGLRRFVLFSSQAAAGPSPTKDPIDEEVPAHPITTYGRSKLAAEQECLAAASAIKCTIIRPPVVYGPRDKDVFEFFHTVSKGLQPMAGLSEKFVSMIHVADLIRGTVMAADSPKAVGETYFISSKGVYGWRDLGEISRRALGKKVLRVRIPEPGIYAIAAVAELMAKFSSKPALINFEKARDMVQNYWTCDSSKAKRDFGFEQEIPIEEGITSTVQWYKSAGWLK